MANTVLFSSINKGSKKTRSFSLNNKWNRYLGPAIDGQQLEQIFTSIAKKTVENINPSCKSPVELIQQNLNSFSLNGNALKNNKILNATKLLANKKTQDHTGVSSHFVKQSISVLIDLLFHIFNLSPVTPVTPV